MSLKLVSSLALALLVRNQLVMLRFKFFRARRCSRLFELLAPVRKALQPRFDLLGTRIFNVALLLGFIQLAD